MAAVLVAVAGIAAVFVFASPQLQAEPGTEMVNLAEQDYISPAAARGAFAAEGLPLPYAFTVGSPRSTVLSNSPPGEATSEKLSVFVGARTGRVGFGPKLHDYDERFENVMVTYGVDDEAVLAQIRAAVATLKN